MISALIQSEAAILAIVITLSLVAVQQSASSYSPRVIEIFKDPNENPDLWILIFIYTVSIIYGTFVLKILNGDSEKLSDFQSHIWFTYWLGVLAFSSLKSYTSNTLKLLTPLNIIERLSQRSDRIATDNLSGNKIEELLSPINSIIDIINSSLLKYDYETAKTGIKAIKKNTSVIIENITIDKKIRCEVQKKIIFDFKRIAILAINHWDKNSIDEIIEYFHLFGTKKYDKTESANFEALMLIIESLNEIGKQTAQKNMADETKKVLEVLDKIGSLTTQNNLTKESLKVINAIEIIGIETVKQGMEEEEKLSVKTLESIGNLALQQGSAELINKIIYDMEKICIFAIKQNDSNIFNLLTLQALLDIGKEIIRKQNKVMENQSMLASTEKIEMPAYRFEENIELFEEALVNIFLSFESIAKEASKQKNMENVIDSVGKMLAIIQKLLTPSFQKSIQYVSILNEKKDVEEIELIFLASIEYITIEMRELILSLRAIGKISIEIQTDETRNDILSALKAIGVSATKQEANMKLSIENIEELLTLSSFSLKEVGLELCKHENKEDKIKVVVSNLKDIGVSAAKYNKENTVKNVVEYLNNIGLKSLEQKKGKLSIEILSCIKEIITNSNTLLCLPFLEGNFKEFKRNVLLLINSTCEGIDRVNKLKTINSLD